MLEVDIDEDEERATGKLDLARYAKKYGRSIPMAVLRRALGKRHNRFQSAVAICAIIRVPAPQWVAPMLAVGKIVGDWATTYDGSATGHYLRNAEANAIDKLAAGGRVLVVATRDTVPARLVAAADLVVDIDGLTVGDVKRAIREVTGGRPRDLHAHDVAGLDLMDAIAAVRVGTTAASCIERIRAATRAPTAAIAVIDAPLLSEMRGYGEAARWAEQLEADLQRWRKGELDFSALQHNIVLAGPPGVGKTSFVRSLARTLNIPLLVSSMGTLFSTTQGYLDSITKGIDKLFAEARAAGPTAIVLLDELEGIPARSGLDGRHAAWWTPVVNHFLTVLDGASQSSSNLIVIGATNYPSRLDDALIRPGRLDKVVWIDPPTEADLVHIYRQHLGTDLPGDDLGAAAALSIGATGAAARGHVIGARARARQHGRQMVLEDLLKEILPPHRLPPAVARRAAIHEAGHAVLAVLLGTVTIKSVSIGGREPDGSDLGGRVVFERQRFQIDSEDLQRAEALQLLGGRAAEQVLLGDASAGSGGSDSSDLARVTGILAAQHLSYGLRERLSYVVDADRALVVARQDPSLMAQVEMDLQQLYQEAKEMVEHVREVVAAVADALIENSTISGEKLSEIVHGRGAQKGAAHHA